MFFYMTVTFLTSFTENTKYIVILYKIVIRIHPHEGIQPLTALRFFDPPPTHSFTTPPQLFAG